MRCTCQTNRQSCGYQGHHHVEGGNALEDLQLLVPLLQDAVYLASMPLACGRVAEHQPLLQHHLQRNAPVLQQGVAQRQRHHQFVIPRGSRHDAVAYLVRHRQARVVQVFLQASDLLIQWYLEQADFYFGLFLAATGQQGRQPRWRDTVGQGNAQLAMKPTGGRFRTIARLFQCLKDTWNPLQKYFAGMSQSNVACGTGE
ncbi:hypothetical protein DM44_1857 [Burkholderia cepacia]|nr:hypothetical protein DM42_2058 [Burkholderia cepacia]KGB95535.1 hypothetical protein DM44_1857 [Burkholderia cepacia]